MIEDRATSTILEKAIGCVLASLIALAAIATMLVFILSPALRPILLCRGTHS